MNDKRDPLLTTRETTHGDYTENAKISQAIKFIFRSSPGWSKLDSIERESMDLIATKFARILASGAPLQYEHWIDVKGYAELVVEKCGR
jgi:hypothetical protein